MLKVAAVVVTYNRLNLLMECVESLLNQTYKNLDIIIVDNASTDGTLKYIQNLNNPLDKVKYFRMDKNVGGAGGFFEGIKRACSTHSDWVWLMDDDTIPEKNALEELCIAAAKIQEPVGFIASNVYGMSKKAMNTPKINFLNKGKNGYSDWNEYLSESLVKVYTATFCSIFISTEAVKKVGLPIKSYFLWGDDTEYTLRLTYYFGQGWIAGKSRVLHKREIEKALSIIEEESLHRIDNYYYYIRNYLINLSLYFGYAAAILKTIHFIIFIILIALGKYKYKLSKINIILRGLGAFWLKRYDFNEVSHRIPASTKRLLRK